jgi:hypothetical protein
MDCSTKDDLMTGYVNSLVQLKILDAQAKDARNSTIPMSGADLHAVTSANAECDSAQRALMTHMADHRC